MTAVADQRLPSTSGARRSILWVLALGYGTVLALIVFWPSPIDRPVSELLSKAIAALHRNGVPTFVDYGFIEFAANILLFLPAGLFFGLLIPMRWCVFAFLAGPALSALIELAQRHLLEARYATVSDLIANSIGATIGVVIALILRAVVHARDVRVVERYLAATARNAR